MATYYFLGGGSAPTDWDDGDNWYNAPSGGTNGTVPTSSDDAVISAIVDTASISSPATIYNMTIDSGGVISTLTVVCTNGCTVLNGGYFGDSATITGNVVCTTGGIIGYNDAGGTINGNLTFENNGESNGNITYVDNLYFANNWTGSVSYITVSMDVIYFYGYTGTATNLTVSGNTYYSNFPTLYYNAADNDDWANYLNWWVDSGFTQQSYNIPTSSDTVYITSNVGNDSTSSATAAIAYVENSATVAINLTIIDSIYFGDDSSTTVYGTPTISLTLSVSNNVYFVNGNIDSDSTISFGDECRFSNSSINNGTVSANGTGPGSTYFDDSSSNAGTVGVGATPYTVDFSDNSINSGTVNITTNCNYPLNRNTFNSGTINGTITYVSYPTFYFYGTSQNWYTLTDWYVDSGHATPAAYIPGSLDDIVLEVGLGMTSSNVYAKNATITTIYLLSNAYTFYVSEMLTVGSGGQIGDGMSTTYIEADSAEFTYTSAIMGSAQLTTTTQTDFKDSSSLNGGTVIAGSPGVRFYDTSTFAGGTITGDITIFSPVPLPFTIGGSYSGSLLYSGYSSRLVYFYSASSTDWSDTNNWWSDSAHTTQTYIPVPGASIDDVIVESNLTQNTSSLDTTIGVLTVQNDADVSINITCLTATFEDTSSFAQNNTAAVLDQNSSTVSITFSDISTNHGYITVTDTGSGTPAVVFEDGSSNYGYIDGNVQVYYPVSIPIGNISFITGTITYFNYPYYFNDTPSTGGGDWNDPDNWFLDSAMTVPANTTPTEIMPGDNVILQSNVQTSSGGTPTANDLSCDNLYVNITITVNGLATFSNSGYLDSSGTITGDARFITLGTNRGGTVTGYSTFDLESAAEMISNGYDGTYGNGMISPPYILFEYGKGVNGSSILGVV